jgi:mRNA interferase MazF
MSKTLPPTIASYDAIEAPSAKVVLKADPKIRAVYWCRFWKDALKPEFFKTRPVVVVSRNNMIDGPIMVVPLTTKPQGTNKWAYKLSQNPIVKNQGLDSWAICNHVYTVSCARLTQVDGGAPRMLQTDFDEVVRLMMAALPAPPLLVAAVVKSLTVTVTAEGSDG